MRILTKTGILTHIYVYLNIKAQYEQVRAARNRAETVLMHAFTRMNSAPLLNVH